MKKHFQKIQKGIAFFLALSILFISSCTKFPPNPATPVQKVAIAAQLGIKPFTDVEMKKLTQGTLKTCSDFKAYNQKDDITQNGMVKNLQDYYTSNGDITPENFDILKTIVNGYTNVETFDEMGAMFVQNNLYTQNQVDLMSLLDQKMQTVESLEDYKAGLDWFGQKIESSSVLDKNEKAGLQVYHQILNIDYAQMKTEFGSSTGGSEETCGECLWRKKWKIFGWSAGIIAAIAIACLVGGTVTFGGATAVCIAAGANFGSVLAVSLFTAICLHCPMCCG